MMEINMAEKISAELSDKVVLEFVMFI